MENLALPEKKIITKAILEKLDTIAEKIREEEKKEKEILESSLDES